MKVYIDTLETKQYFFEAKDEDGWLLYFTCWKIFNFFTKPFPKLRYNIINSLIPKFMNYRKKKLKNENK